VYEDEPPFHTSDGRPVRLDYAVATETPTATGATSNFATIVPLLVPVPPANLQATAKPEGIVLAWQAPQAVVTGSEKPRITGYNIYRVAQGQTADELASPINSSPVGQTTYTDAPAYGTYEYRITAVVVASPPRIESDPSSAVTATFKDLVPPPTPTGLTVLVETGAVRLVWDPVEAADLAGYKVYRIEGSGIPISGISKPLPLTPTAITTTYYRDTGVVLGISYYYQVSAIDKSGNESAPAKTDWVLVPKTP
jgi:fibronectin type 3 domain-containing protein